VGKRGHDGLPKKQETRTYNHLGSLNDKIKTLIGVHSHSCFQILSASLILMKKLVSTIC
jgi:hypothetical protein